MGGMVIPERGDKGEMLNRAAGIPVDDRHRVRHKGIYHDTITTAEGIAGKDIDWKIEQMQYNQQDVHSVFIGVDLVLDGGNVGDAVDFCVGDKDGVGVAMGLYDQATFDFLKAQGNGFVALDQFGDGYFLRPDSRTILREYKADLYPGLYIRTHYKMVAGATNEARLLCNILRYIETP